MYGRCLQVTLVASALAACGGEVRPPPAGAPPALQTITVAAEGAAGGLMWDGVVQAVEQAVLSAQTSGRVAVLSADVDQPVARGAVLLRLTSEEQAATVDTARARLRAVDAELADATSRFVRASGLVDRQLIARDDFDRVRAAQDSLLASRDAAAAQLAQQQQQLGYTVVRAPYAGIIAARQVELGETVSPGQPLFTLYAPGQLRLEVLLPQATAEAVRRNPTAIVTLPDGRTLDALKSIVFPGADPLAHSNAVRVPLPALDVPLRPGQTVKVRFAAAAGPAGIWLPAAAIAERGELAAAYVVQDDTIVMRQLRLGQRIGQRVQVVSGLLPGERVAADAVAALQAMRERQAQSHGG